MMQLPLTAKGVNNIEAIRALNAQQNYALIMYYKCLLQGLLQFIDVHIS